MQDSTRPPRPADADSQSGPKTGSRVTLRLDEDLHIVGCKDPARVLGIQSSLKGRHLSSLLPEQSCLTRRECIANFASLELRQTGELPPDIGRLVDELRLSEQRFRLLFETNPLPLWIYDLENFAFLAVNDAAAAMYGYTRAELLDMQVHALWPEEHVAEMEKEVTRPRGAGFHRVGVRTRVKKGGSRLQAEIYTHDLVFKGRPARLVIANDVTEQQRNQRMMARGSRALEMLAGRAPLHEVLEELCRALEEEAGAGCHCSILLLDNGRFTVAAAPRLPEAFVQAVEGSLVTPDAAVWEGEVVVAPDIARDPLWHGLGGLALGIGLRSSWSVPIVSGQGAVVGVFAACHETARTPTHTELAYGKRIAQIAGIAIDHHASGGEVRRLNAELEQRVRLRTAQLEAANRELESFSYTIAHDLRAPLRAISGYSTLLLSDHAEHLDAEGRGHARRIATVGKRMAEMIDALLDLSRLSRVELVRTEVNLSDIAATIADELRSGDSARRVEFHIAPDVTVEADKNLMTVVMQNLISNAWKFTRQAQHARIEFGCGESEGGRVCFVRDNGAGFDMQYADKLFAPFERLHKIEEYEGSGIGLATVRRVIHRHGGRVWAEGRPDEGATFSFTL